jgi:hypothetical protein
MSLTVDSTPLHHAFAHAFTHPLMDFNLDKHKESVIDLTQDNFLASPSASPTTVIDLTEDELDDDHQTTEAPPTRKRKNESSDYSNSDSDSEDECLSGPTKKQRVQSADESTHESTDNSGGETTEEPSKSIEEYKASLPPTWTFTCDRHEDDFERDLGYLYDCGVPKTWDYARIAYITSADDFHFQLLLPHLMEIDHLTDSKQEVTEYHKEAFDIVLKALEPQEE